MIGAGESEKEQESCAYPVPASTVGNRRFPGSVIVAKTMASFSPAQLMQDEWQKREIVQCSIA
jgi:hypothetical protein